MEDDAIICIFLWNRNGCTSEYGLTVAIDQLRVENKMAPFGRKLKPIEALGLIKYM